MSSAVAAETFDSPDFRRVMSLFPTGVTILASAGDHGPAGMTVNSIASLSLEPTLIMVGFDLQSRTLRAVRESGRFAVSFLSRHQEEACRTFASKLPEHEKFAGVRVELRYGVPVIGGAVAWLVCDAEAFHEGGDHVIGVGRVIDMWRDPREPAPLVFYRSGYWNLDDDARRQARAPGP